MLRNRLLTPPRLARSLPVVVGKVYEHNVGKALHSAANLIIATLNKVVTYSFSDTMMVICQYSLQLVSRHVIVIINQEIGSKSFVPSTGDWLAFIRF